jgi:hypothetical protein
MEYVATSERRSLRSAKAPAFVMLKASVPACGMFGYILLTRRVIAKSEWDKLLE